MGGAAVLRDVARVARVATKRQRISKDSAETLTDSVLRFNKNFPLSTYLEYRHSLAHL